MVPARRVLDVAILAGLALSSAYAAPPRHADHAKSAALDATQKQQAILDLTSADEDARDKAIAQLVKLKTQDLVQPAIAAMAQKDAKIREGALAVLAACGGARATQQIASALRRDIDAVVRREACHALRDAAAPKVAIPALANAARTDEDERVRRAAILDLGRVQDPDAFDALVEIFAASLEAEDAYATKLAMNAMTLLGGEANECNLEAWTHCAARYRARVEAAAAEPAKTDDEPTQEAEGAEASETTTPSSDDEEQPNPKGDRGAASQHLVRPRT